MSVETVTTGPSAPAHVPPELVRDFDLAGLSGAAECPYSRLSRLRGEARIIYTPPSAFQPAGSWLLTHAADIRSVLQQPETFSSDGIAGFSRLVGESWPLIPLELDPPQHEKFRAILNGIFAPKKIAAMEEGVRARAGGLIDAVKDERRCEFVEAFGRPFPVSIFMQLMGLPDEDMGLLNGWEFDLLHSRDMESRFRGARGFLDYLRALIVKRRSKPADDLTTFVVQSQVDGRPLTDDEVMGVCYLLVVAGLDTVASSLSLHFRHLAQNPDDQARLRADPSLIPSAVEEFLRRYGIVSTSRFATRDAEIAGVKIKAGDRVAVLTQLASLDPDEFENPLEVDIERTPNRHVAFSYGPHRCIGSHLARRELVIAIEEWLKRVPPFRIADGAEVPIATGGLLHVAELPLVWG
jgi:cytochrome P450